MSKKRKRGDDPPPDGSRLNRMFGDATPPEPQDKAFVAAIEERLANYNPADGKLDLSPMTIGAERIAWVVSRLASLTGLTTLNIRGNSIGDEGVKAIAESLTGLTTLNIRGNSIGEEGAKAIAESLTGLTTLNIGDNSIGEEGAKAIAASLTGLTTLDISYNTIGAEGAKAIAASLTGLTTLDIGNNSIGEEGAKAIAESLTGLTTLDIRRNSIGEEGAKAIAESLTGLTTLYISGNSIGEEGAKAIAASLTGLTALNIGGNSIGDEGAKAIAASLTGLTTLDIGGNSIGEEGAKAIAESLTGLTTLNIWSNSIGDEGAKAISESLPGLTTLNIGYNSIGDEGAKAIAESLTGLTTLDIRHNSIGEEGAKAIAASLTGLTTLYIGGNSIGEEGAKAIAASLTVLTTLDISGNSIGEEGVKAIAASLTGLTTLYIWGNSIGDEGAKAIADSLTGLTTLYISGNSIGDEGAKAIADSLTGLTTLDIGGNSIGEEGAKAIAESLTGLTTLNIGGSSIGEEGARAIADSLTGLTTLNISANSIGEADAIVRLIESIRPGGNPGGKLEKITVEGNPLRWPGMDAPISDSILEEDEPVKLRDALLRVRDEGVTTRYARLTTAGVSGAGKTHYTRRLENPDDPALNEPLQESNDRHGRITVGVRSSQISFAPRDYGVEMPNLRMVVQDVGGHRQQQKAHHHLVYLTGESVYVLCVNLRKSIRGWPTYYMSLLEDLARRTYCKGKPLARNELSAETFPEQAKLRVVVVPTHKDKVDPATTAKRIGVLRNALKEHWMLACALCDPISNLAPGDHQKVNKLVAEQLPTLPGLAQRTLKFVPALCGKVQAYFAQAKPDGSGVMHATLSLEKIREECERLDGYQDGDLKVAVLELLRLGEAMAPLSETPERDDGNPVERVITRVLNPKFVNEELYDLLMDRKLISEHAGFVAYGDLKNKLGLTRDEEKLVVQMLQEHMVAFEYEHAGMPKGLLVPDRLPERKPADCPEQDSKAIVFTFDGFVPEWALFELMSKRKATFDPIDPARGLFAYRDMCQFRMRASETAVRVHLDVLRREARMYGNGMEAAELMRQFADELAGFAGCGVRRDGAEIFEAVSEPSAGSSAEPRNSDAAHPSQDMRSKTPVVVGQSISGKPGLPLETLKKLVGALIFRHRWHGTKKDLAKRFKCSESQILRLLNPEYPKNRRNPHYDQALAAQMEKNKYSNITGRKDGKPLDGATLDSTHSSTEIRPDKSAELNDVPEPWRSMDRDVLKKKALELEPTVREDELPEHLHQLRQMVWLLTDQRSDNS